METKVCTTCKEEKPLDAFYRRVKGSPLRRASCKACRNRTIAEERAKNNEKKRLRQENQELKDKIKELEKRND